MVLLRLLSGSLAGQETVARRFPFRVGRGAQEQLRIEQPGVWESHFVIERPPGQTVALRALAGAITLVNGERVETVALRNGDVIEAGAARLRFWLSPVNQAGLVLRESLTWLGLVAITAFEIIVAVSLTR